MRDNVNGIRFQRKGAMKVQDNSIEQAFRASAPFPGSAAKLPQHVPTVALAYAVRSNLYTNGNLPVTVLDLGLADAELRKAL